jgi:NADH:ubiquinone oxidoreductase subunit E
MEEDMMNMQVSPVMQPEQPMMQGTPAPQELPGELQQELDQISESDQEEAQKALMQLIKILQQMVAQGASDEEIQAFLDQVGITMEELQMAREMFGI